MTKPDRFKLIGGGVRKVYIIGGEDGEVIGTINVVGALTDAELRAEEVPVLIEPAQGAVGNEATAAADTAVVITKAANATLAWVLGGVYWSYNDTPTGGNLLVENGVGSAIVCVDITAGGPGFLPFSPPIRFSPNTALVVTLAAAGEVIVGRLNINAWTE